MRTVDLNFARDNQRRLPEREKSNEIRGAKLPIDDILDALAAGQNAQALIGEFARLAGGDPAAAAMLARLERVSTVMRQREDALAEAERRLAVITSQLPGLAFGLILGPRRRLRFTYASGRDTALLGFGADELVRTGERLLEAFPSEADASGFLDLLAEAGRQLQAIDAEIRLKSRTGPLRRARVTAQPTHLGNGAVLWEGLIREVGAGQSAGVAPDALSDAVGSLACGFALFDCEDRLVLHNGRCAELCPPRSADALEIGATFEALLRAALAAGSISTEGAASVEDHVRERVARHRQPSGAIERRLADGRTILVSESRTAAGGIAHISTDITELKRQESELRRKSLLLQTTLDSIDQGMRVCDRNLRIVAFNRRFLELREVPPHLARVGVSVEDFIRYNAQRGEYGPDIEAQVAERVALLRRGKPYVLELTRPNGVVLEIRSNPMPDGGLVTIYTDITEREQARAALRHSEERLLERVQELETTRERLEVQRRELSLLAETLVRAKEEAETASRTKSEFLANMSHELRTPLNAIIGFSDVMQRGIFGPLGERYRGYARDIYESGTHLLDVITDILDLSKIEAGRLTLLEEEVELSAIFASCERLVRERADKGGVKLTVDLDGFADLPLLLADQIKIKQILLNLLSNALKFTPRGGSVVVAGHLEAAGSLVIEVRDTGIGMTEEQIGLALQPFRQVDTSLARRHEGTGLGLPLTKSLVELHQGELVIESKFGAGTRALVRFPRERTRPRPTAS